MILLGTQQNEDGFTALPVIEHRSYGKAQQDLLTLYGPEQSHSRCLAGRSRILNLTTGEIRPAMCTSSRCVSCSRVYRRTFRAALALTAPTYSLRLSGLTDPGCHPEDEQWPHSGKRMAALIKSLRRAGLDVNLAYIIERNPRRTGLHAHGYGYGSPLTASRLTEHAERVGLLGKVYIRPVAGHEHFDYALKSAAWNSESLKDFRSLNGGHRYHPTRPFLRDASTGETCDLDTAAARFRALSGVQRSQWVYLHSAPRPGSALTPRAAAPIRSRLAARAMQLMVRSSGQVLSRRGAPVTTPLGVGVVGTLILRLDGPDGPLALLDRQFVPVVEVAA